MNDETIRRKIVERRSMDNIIINMNIWKKTPFNTINDAQKIGL